MSCHRLRSQPLCCRGCIKRVCHWEESCGAELWHPHWKKTNCSLAHTHTHTAAWKGSAGQQLMQSEGGNNVFRDPGQDRKRGMERGERGRRAVRRMEKTNSANRGLWKHLGRSHQEGSLDGWAGRLSGLGCMTSREYIYIFICTYIYTHTR